MRGRYHNNALTGMLLILLSIMIFCIVGLCYPALTYYELFDLHPIESWGIPGVLFIIGSICMITSKDEEDKND